MERSTQNRLTNEFFLVPFSIHRLILKLRGQRTFVFSFLGHFYILYIGYYVKNLAFCFCYYVKNLAN